MIEYTRKMAKKSIISFILLLLTGSFAWADEPQKPFKGYLYNSEYDVYIRMNLYDQDIIIPGQELFGQLPGYLSKNGTSYCWLFVTADVSNPKSAQLQVSNDYGSEDFTAKLTQEDDSTYVLQHLGGSVLKMPKNGKWQKLPNTLKFKKK